MPEVEQILVVEDDDGFRETLIKFLSDLGYDTVGAPNGLQAIKLAKERLFNIVVADIRLPGALDGIDVLHEIRTINDFPSQMIVMTGYADKEAPRRAIELGVDDYIYKPFELDEFLHVIRKSSNTFRLERMVDYYRNLSNRDSITGLYNHRYFYEIIDRELKRAVRYNHPLSLFMIDIDDFKKCNDNYGHLTGDIILRKMAEILQQSVRTVDIIFRYAGDEFTILLPESDKKNSLATAERIRKAIDGNNFELSLDPEVRLTVSIGVAEFPSDAQGKESLIEVSDKALYTAKKAGKNKVLTWEREI